MELWLDWRVPDSNTKRILQTIHPHINRIVISSFSEDLCHEEFQGIPVFKELEDGGLHRLVKLTSQGAYPIGAAIRLNSPESQQQAMSLVGSVEWLQLCSKDWTMIPAENLIAVSRNTPTKICFKASDPSQVQGLAYALQLGVDALLLEPDVELWREAIKVKAEKAELESTKSQQVSSVQKSMMTDINLSPVEVIEILEGGVGDRVCLDFVQLLKEGEGCLVGSSAKALTLVHAETFSTGFVPSRPFRVNAGPVHSYVLMGDGTTTKYLCEVQSGDKVLVVNERGHGRAVTVGRCKIEPRPMLMVKFKDISEEGKTGQVFVQQAETVNFVSPLLHSSKEIPPLRGESAKTSTQQKLWRPVSITLLEKGNIIYAYLHKNGTHIGKEIIAAVTEI